MTIIEKLARATAQNTAFVFDFDGTIIHKYVNQFEVPSIISILRSDRYLGEEYSKAAYELKEKYGAIETSPTSSSEEKLSAAQDWWQEHGTLLIRHGLSMKAISEVAQDEKLVIRSGFKEVLGFASKKSIPVFIFSASGFGKDCIREYLKYNNLDTSNIHIISNSFVYDEDGVALERKDPVIHSMNKNEEVLKFFHQERDLLYSKKFVILAGDSTEDPKMVSEKNHEAVYRIGFYPTKDESAKSKMLPLYEELYDVTLYSDSEMIEQASEIIDLLS